MIEIIRNWKKKRQDRKQAEHEKLLVELKRWWIGDEQNYYKGKERDSHGIQRGKIKLQSQK